MGDNSSVLLALESSYNSSVALQAIQRLSIYVFYCNLIDFSTPPFFSLQACSPKQECKACGSSVLCTVFVVYYYALAWLYLFFFPSPKKQTQKVRNYFYSEVQTNTCDLNKTK